MSEPEPESAEPPDTPDGVRVGRPGPLMRVVRNQKLAFLLVGGFNTVLGTLWFIGWQTAIGDHADYRVSIVLGYLCNVACAFAMYRYLVFEVRGNFFTDLWRFVVVNLGAFVTNMILMTIAVSVLGFPPIPAQIAITAITAVASFFGYRDFSFRRSKKVIS